MKTKATLDTVVLQSPTTLAFFSEEKVRRLITDMNGLLEELNSRPVPISYQSLCDSLGEAWICLARTAEGRFIGMASLFRLHKLSGYTGFIEDVVVLPEYRRQGVARAILTRLHERAREGGMKKIDLTSRPNKVDAQYLYPSMGYQKRDTNVYRIEL